MELSYDSSDWASDDEGHHSARRAAFQPKPKRMCQVPGCTADLEAIGKPYCSVKRICPVHMKADIIPVRGQIMRFCQQCGVLEPLSLFDFTKRSCRDSLSRRVKHPPSESEQRPKRKRKPNHASEAPSHSGYWSAPFIWAATDAAADTAAAAAMAAYGGMGEVGWDAAYIAAAGPLPVSSGLPAVDAAAWGSAAAGLAVLNSGWLELPSADQQAAAAADGSSPESLVSPASSSCTAAAAAAAAAAAPPPAPYRGSGVAALMTPSTFGSPAPCSTHVQQQALKQEQQQQQQQQPVCPPGLAAAAAAGLSSRGSGSYSSGDVTDPAVLELEQFMLQELAAAGVIVNDSGSTTQLPTVLAPAATQPQPQPVWQHASLKDQQHQLQQQQQQQQQPPPDANPIMHYQQPPAMQLRQPEQHRLQQPQMCGFLPSPGWHNSPAAPVAQLTAGCASPASTPAAAAVAAWVPAGACGSNLPSPGAASAQQQQQQQHGALQAASLPVAAAGVRGSSSRAEMMARLQSRLHVLQSQMEDMQLMLGLLKEA